MKNLVRWASATCVVLLTATALDAGELPSRWRHWSHFRDIGIDTAESTDAGHADGLIRVAIPETIFRSARSDLADLRVIDDGGDDLGFVIYAPGRQAATEWRPTATSDFGFVPDRYTQIVVDAGEGDALHNAVEIRLAASDEEFFAWVEVAASSDRETWRVVRDRAPLYRFRDRGFDRPTTVGYPRTRDRWLRLRVLSGATEVAIEGVRVAERVEEDPSLQRIRRKLLRRADSPEGESWWEPQGSMSSLPIAAARFETAQAAFHRPVRIEVSDDGKSWRQAGEGSIYRYPPDDPGAEEADAAPPRQSLQIDARDASAALWRVIVLDRDDPPLADLEVTLLQNQRYVVFRPTDRGAHRLLYGNQRAPAPEYDLEKIVSREALAAAPLGELGEERANEAWVSSEPFTERHPVILWTALGLAVLMVAGLALKTLRG